MIKGTITDWNEGRAMADVAAIGRMTPSAEFGRRGAGAPSPGSPRLRRRRLASAFLLLLCVAISPAPFPVRARAAEPADAGAVLSWAIERLDEVSLWDRQVAEQSKAIDQLSESIADLAAKIQDADARINRLSKLIKAIDDGKPRPPDEFRLQLVTLHRDASGMPVSDRSSVIVGRLGETLYFRLFDPKGNKLIDEVEETGDGVKAQRTATLKGYLRQVWPSTGSRPLTHMDEDLIILGVTSIVGLNATDFLDRLRRADEQLHRAEAEFFAASAHPYDLQPDLARLVVESAVLRLENVCRDRQNLLEHTLPKKERRKVLEAARDDRVAWAKQLSDLKEFEVRQRSKLKQIADRATAAGLSENESRIIKYLEIYHDNKDKPTDLAERSLAEASRLWRQEMSRQFGMRLNEFRGRPAPRASTMPGAPPAR
jgi:hypothetical protein